MSKYYDLKNISIIYLYSAVGVLMIDLLFLRGIFFYIGLFISITLFGLSAWFKYKANRVFS